MTSSVTRETRVIALTGPFHSGKTTLLESIAAITGASHKKATNGQRLIGDESAEAKAREMGIDLNFLTTGFLGERYSFIDCPGSIELMQDTLNILPFVDAAVIVSEPDTTRIHALTPLFKELERLRIPRFVMINKVDKAGGSLRALAEDLSKVSSAPVVMRHIPVRDGEYITGYVDLAAAKARIYRPGEGSQIINMPKGVEDRFKIDRYTMLEKLADFDDEMLETLLEDLEPERDDIYADLTLDVQQGLIVPIFLGAALLDEGTRRLLKALRHEVPPFQSTLARLGIISADSADIVAPVIKTIHTQHAGKLSIVRHLSGQIKDGDELNSERVSGLFSLTGQSPVKTTSSRIGDVIGLGRMEKVATGDILTRSTRTRLPRPGILAPVYALALHVDNRNDEVKMSGALTRLCEEDPSLRVLHDPDTQEYLLTGQGEVHLNIAIDRMKSRYGIIVSTKHPQVPYKESIRKTVTQHSRHKKQSGGHGQFGDVVVEITPLPSGTGIQFQQNIHGGSIPKHYIPSVENGVRDSLRCGPLGFPVVDVGVTLLDGKYHAVDSSDMAFQLAGRQAVSDALPNCAPILLEPIQHVKIHIPNEFTARTNSLVATRRGQILGFNRRDGWLGWDSVEANIPQAEMGDLIIELRSLTAGAGTYEAHYDHLSELTGRLADDVISARHARA